MLRLYIVLRLAKSDKFKTRRVSLLAHQCINIEHPALLSRNHTELRQVNGRPIVISLCQPSC